jgi:glycosyltransferase involved in cell wall biosynthesis
VSIINKRISDIELKPLYSNAKAVILIQHNCLASNVVLESIAMNVPLLTNRIGDIEEYLGMEYPLFIDMEENIYRFIHDKDYSREIELYLDRIKLNFSWKEIAEKTIKFIKK